MRYTRDDRLSVEKNGVLYLPSRASTVKRHSHGWIEFAYVRSGRMEHHIHGQRRILQAGDYFIVDHGVTHAYKRVCEDRLVVENILFTPAFLDKGLVGTNSFSDVMRSYLLRFCYQTLHSDPAGQTFRDEDGRIGALVERIGKEYQCKNYGYLELIRCSFVEVLVLTMRKLGKKTVLSAKSEVVQKMVKYVDEHFRERMRLNRLAEQLGYNPAYLSQKFIQETGSSFMEYLHQVRVDRSCHLLETTDMKIGQIAAEVGYDDVKFFNQVFKKRLSVTPRAFRSAHK